MAEESENKNNMARDNERSREEDWPHNIALSLQTWVNNTPARQDLDDLEERHPLKDTKMMEGKMEISKKLWDGEQPKPLHSYTAQAQDFKKEVGFTNSDLLGTIFQQ